MAYGRSAPRQFHLLHEYKRNIGGMGFFRSQRRCLSRITLSKRENMTSRIVALTGEMRFNGVSKQWTRG